jgi:hypothetical protein
MQLVANWKRTKGHTTIYKTLHRKLKIEQQEADKKPGVNSEVPALLVIFIYFLACKMFIHKNTIFSKPQKLVSTNLTNSH